MAAAVGGFLLGAAVWWPVGAASVDPTESQAYKDVAWDLEVAEGDLREAGVDIEAVEGRLSEVRAERDELAEVVDGVDEREAELEQLAKDLKAQQSDVEAREAAVASTEQRIAATTITGGTWTVGRDIEPGTYRTKEAVTGSCYWGIYTSGTNQNDIQANDNVDGGFPTVTLSVGQDFVSNRCGSWIKQ